MSTLRKQCSQSCYVFIDDSNLWIAGKKARGKKLVDTDTDSRFRVDLGRFLDLVTKGRNLSQAFLYGSVPPPNDTVWKAAKERNFEVKTFKRSALSGKEKQVDVAMAHDITKTFYCLKFTKGIENIIFITVTGDCDLKPPILDALENGMPVELWSWEDAMAQEFRRLANTHALLTANSVDKIQESFGYTAYMSTRKNKDIDPAHAIVYKDVPGGKPFLYRLLGHLNQLMRLFFITSVDSQAGGKQDLIIEFPKSELIVVTEELDNLGEFEETYTLPVATSRIKQD